MRGQPLQLDRETIVKEARRYHTNRDADRGLGIASGMFVRLCRRHGIEDPTARKMRTGVRYRR